MKRIKVIFNPVAGRGYSGRVESEICRYLKEAGLDFDLVYSERKGHAIELAEQAVGDGFEIIAAAGGDGTTNEVINGLMAASKRKNKVNYSLALFPTGSGNDFTYNAGVPADFQEVCRLIAKGKTRIVDLGKVSIPGKEPRYFDNQLGIGFDGVVTLEARKFKRVRGMALYLPVVLKTVFLTNKATRVTIEYDDKKLELPIVQVSVANGRREGGGFYMAPGAKLDDGYFDLIIVGEIGKLAMLGIISKFMKGTHTEHKATITKRAKKITITSEDDLIAHFDGEMLCTDGHRIECEIVPQCLRVFGNPD
ncbi:MAG: diacylglycerol kinase family lipid kinase [Candidatus Aminicenantes bacterium]|nr:diacylglycerol kinase family lipid kinase [Candidatus Aminicenantes bacterium]